MTLMRCRLFQMNRRICSNVSILLLCAALSACGLKVIDAKPVAKIDLDLSKCQELLKNGGFEDDQGLSPWLTAVHANRKAFEFSVDTSFARSGRASAKILSHGKEPWGYLYQNIRGQFHKGDMIIVQLWSYEKNSNENAVVHLSSSDGRYALESVLTHSTHATAWISSTHKFEIMSDSKTITTGVAHHGDGVLWVDDMRAYLCQSV